jgi:hypothetical protein
MAFDNGDYFYSDDFVFADVCPACGTHTNFQEHNPAYRQTRRRRSEVLTTYDGQKIVTKAFKSFCEAQHYPGVEMLGFINDPEHFHLVVHQDVEMDEVASQIEKVLPCRVCGHARSLSRAKKALPYLACHKPLPDGIWRSNLAYGDGDYKFYLIFVGRETRKKMKAAGLKGLLFEEVYGGEES